MLTLAPSQMGPPLEHGGSGTVPCSAAVGEACRQRYETSNALKTVTSSLSQALANNDAPGALALLDSLAQTARENLVEDFCAETIAEACSTCSAAVVPAQWGPAVSYKALVSLTGLLQLYRQNGISLDGRCQCSRELGLVPLAKQVSLALSGCVEPEILAAGLSALHALAGSLPSISADPEWSAEAMLDAVGDTGAVEAAAAALQQLAARQPSPEAAAALGSGLDVLYCVCAGHPRNLARLAGAGGPPVVAAAVAAAPHAAIGLLLLAQLGAREGAPVADAHLAALALLGAAASGGVPQQPAALRGLHLLMSSPAGTAALPAEELLGAVLSLLQAGAAVPEGSERGALAAQVYGMAVVGRAAGALPAPPTRPTIELLQAALSHLCALLAMVPGTVSFEPCSAATADGVVDWEVLQAGILGVAALLEAAGPEGINLPDKDGYTLLHRLAPCGLPQALELLLSRQPSSPGCPPLDLLVRTREGANALQLAVRAGAAACSALLEPATQAAAQAVADALLAEEEAEGRAKGAGGKKKKVVTRSSSFASSSNSEQQQSGEKEQQRASEGTSSAADAAQATAAETAVPAPTEEDLRRQELEDAYERALEARRRELEAQAAQRAQQAQQAAQLQHSPVASPQPSASTAPGPQPAPGGAGAVSLHPVVPPPPPHSPQPTEGGPVVSAFSGVAADAATADSAHTMVSAFAAAAGRSNPPSPPAAMPLTARQTAFNLSDLDLSTAVSGGLPTPPHSLPPVSMAPALSGELPLQNSPHLSAFSAFASSTSSPFEAASAPFPAASTPFAAQSVPLPVLPSNTPFASASNGSFAPGSYNTPSPALLQQKQQPASAFAAQAALRQQMSGQLQQLASAVSGGLDHFSAFAQQQQLQLQPAGSQPMPSQTPPGVLPYPGDQQRQHSQQLDAQGRAFSSQPHEQMFMPYPEGGPGSPPGNAAAATAAALRAHRAASLPLQLQGRANSAADEILSLLPLASGSGVAPGAAAAAGLEGLARQASQQQALDALAAAMLAGEAGPGAVDAGAKNSDPDVSGEPTRHLWIGNLGTRTPRSVLKTIFEKFGVVDDVVTFPGRMYAFVNYHSLEEAVAAYAAMQGQVVPELTGDRPLLLKFRPAKKAAAHLRALGLAPEEGEGRGPVGAMSIAHASPASLGLGSLPGGLTEAERLGGSGAGSSGGGAGDVDKDGNSLEPSPRIWLGNIAPTATSKSLHAVLSRFGALTDAAVFPARIGPLGYAFVKFERLEDAMRAYEALNNTVVPPLSGSKQLKMRYKPPSDGPSGKDDPADGSRVMIPSRHLWLGNVTQKPNDESVLEVFAQFGKVDSVRVFPVKAYAFVNYAEIASAIKAMSSLEGVPIPALTGVKPLVMRYQQEAVVAAATAAAGATAAGGKPTDMAGLASQLLPGSGLPSLLGGAVEEGPGGEELQFSVPNLSNRLNPNNVHFDPTLAERYKGLSRREKDMLWATDQLMAAHQLAAAAQQQASAGGVGDPQHVLQRNQALLPTMLRSHSWNVSMLAQHLQTVGPNQPANGVSPALAAAAAIAAARQQQQAQATQYDHGQIAAMRLLNPNGEFPQGSNSGGVPGVAPGLQHTTAAEMVNFMQAAAAQQHAAAVAAAGHPPLPPHMRRVPSPPAAPGAPHGAPGASPAQLSAVLSNLAALQRMGQVGASANLAASMQRAASMPVHPSLQHGPLDLGAGASMLGPLAEAAQHDVLAGLGLPPASGPQSDPLDISGLSSMLGGQQLSPPGPSLPPMSPPQHLSSAPGSPPLVGHGGSGSGTPVPDQLLCPLSGQIMIDPVVAADGVTYERKAISEWMALRDTSPITQAPLQHKILTPSMATKAALVNFLQRSRGMGM